MGLAALAFPAALALQIGAVSAATTVVVTPTNTHGWTSAPPLADTRPGGDVAFVADSTAPGGEGALQLTTDLTTTSKAQYMHAAGIELNDVTELSYWTKQVSATFPQGDPSYQLPICGTGFNGTSCNANTTPVIGNATSFTTLVYEPYQGGQGVVLPNVWQQWNIDSTGLFWSTRTVQCSGGTLVGTPGGPATYTLAMVKSICPEAFVLSFGVNIGSNNPGYTVRTDLFDFNGTIYDFELTNQPTDKDQCKNGGYQDFTDANGQPFKNQGQCVSYSNGRGH